MIPVSSGLTTITRSTCGSRIRATSRQLPVTSSATRSDATRLWASNVNPSGVLGTRPAVRTSPSWQIATTQKSRCTSRPIARPVHLRNATSHLPDAVDTQRENQRDNDTDRYVLAAQSRQVAGAAERKARARSPSRKPAYPPAFSQRSPCPGSLDAKAGPGQSLHGAFSCRERRQPRRATQRSWICVQGGSALRPSDLWLARGESATTVSRRGWAAPV